MREAVSCLIKIATFFDYDASHRLETTGSYSLFDEPGSVQIAREYLRTIGVVDIATALKWERDNV